MKNRLTLTLLLAALLTPVLSGCFPAIVAGTAAGVISLHDRRSTGTQTDDETTEWKAAGRIPKEYKEKSRVSFISYNRRVLITGEVPSEEARQSIEQQTRQIEGVRDVYNELTVGTPATLSMRSNDTFLESKVKARLVDSRQISAHHVKVVAERGQVYLMGVVTNLEAKVAITVARTTAGVVKVINIMEILSDEEINRLNEQALLASKKPAAPPAAPTENR
ncbi:MAG: BON domain-containing protein [Azonexus sp.]